MPKIRFAAAFLGATLAVTCAAQAGTKAVIFPFELIDVSLEGQYVGPRPDEEARLALATEELRKRAQEAGYELIDLSSASAELEKSQPLYKCKGCEVDIARRLGADMALAGTVRKLSNLVLVIHLYVSDAKRGNLTRIHRVDLRGNTDETWVRGVRRLAAEGLSGG
jgi:hypothetical protein